ncbi:MAG: hypothetical protein BWY30_00965 [Tenericutes bacterium ADurb.Bin239]|nr:MAG: hypothetical protein BWY30_00965 [Tenericutes bacterium ADurb.Bin239]
MFKKLRQERQRLKREKLLSTNAKRRWQNMSMRGGTSSLWHYNTPSEKESGIFTETYELDRNGNYKRKKP